MSWADDAGLVRVAAAWVDLAWEAARDGCHPDERAKIGESVAKTTAVLRELAAEPEKMGPSMAGLWQTRMEEVMLASDHNPLSKPALHVGNATWQATAIGNEVARRQGGVRKVRWGGVMPWTGADELSAHPDLEAMLAYLAAETRGAGAAQAELDAARAVEEGH